MTNKFELLPMTVQTIHEDQLDCLIIEGRLTHDFGPWKEGERKILTFNFLKGSATEHNDTGEVIRVCEFELSERDAKR